MAINLTSATVTSLVVLIFVIVKFAEGAWIIVVVGPLMYWGLLRFHRQYMREEKAFEANSARAGHQIRTNRVVVFVDNYDLPTERALLYASSLAPFSVRAVHFDVDNLVTKRLEASWGRPNTASANIALEIVECEDRRIDRAALELVADVVRDPDVFCMVILPRRGFVSRLQRLLHDRTADQIADAVMHVPRVGATIMPYSAVRRISEGVIQEEPRRRRGHPRRPAQQRHMAADVKLAERSSDAAPIGGLMEREFVEIAGRVRSMSIGHESGVHELRCVIADNSGSITLVFQGRPTCPASNAARD